MVPVKEQVGYQTVSVILRIKLETLLLKNNKNKNSTNSRYSIFSKDLGLSIISKKQETWSFYARSIKVGKSAKSNSACIKNGLSLITSQ